eukprot:CAMPEP_0119059432 /NCGR_PEP_ID=MMETSP1178-20130426/3593_1 /TAXON_ID=33656 /ORGANISM="unid sp, Strain CCMP2000" /LENGTH=31 /DNA_ID= /DNA_START= /DNA_END= /DNA_ORIENTATION=
MEVDVHEDVQPDDGNGTGVVGAGNVQGKRLA